MRGPLEVFLVHLQGWWAGNLDRGSIPPTEVLAALQLASIPPILYPEYAEFLSSFCTGALEQWHKQHPEQK